MARVLLVEDDRELAGLLESLLVEEGYQVEVARDGQRGLHLGLTASYDVMIFDRGLPAIEGLDLLARLRSQGVNTPVLVLSARANPADKVEGLDAGAEDYLGKPFDIDELLARLRGLLRRHVEHAEVIRVPGGALDVNAQQVTTDAGEAIALTATELELLLLLARNPSRVFSRSELLDAVFDRAADPNAVETYVHYLRRKLGKGVVQTVRGIGYRLGKL